MSRSSSPPVSSPSPTGSKPRRVCVAAVGSRQAAIGMATAPTNRLTRNTQRHPSLGPAAVNLGAGMALLVGGHRLEGSDPFSILREASRERVGVGGDGQNVA